jgi:lysophospholipase L1-like esterase
MATLQHCAQRVGLTALLFAALVGVSCSKAPVAPTPPPPPPPAAAPSISCGSDLTRSTINAGGAAVNFDTPSAKDGEGAVNVSCTPSSGTTFPIGTTDVGCTATDTLNRTATCYFSVTVLKLPTLSKTRFLAFGDSITAGEVTAPISGFGAGGNTKLVVVPAASYPSVLLSTLRGRYSAQAGSMEVFNYGFGGEKVVNARNRFFSALSATLPDALLLMEGANDIPLGEDGAASSAAQEISVWVAEAKARGIRVFLATPTPGKPGSRQIQPILLVDYSDRMRRIAAVQGVQLVDIYNLMLPDVNKYIGVDGLHPNEAGYARIADLFFQAIQATFEVR